MKIRTPAIAEIELPMGVSIILLTHTGALVCSRRIKDGQLGQWQFPGGHVEPGETPLAAAVRELREETGLKVSPARLELIGSEIAIGYSGLPYRGYRYGLVLRPLERVQNPEPHKHTNWEEVHIAALDQLDLIANNKHFARSFYFTRQPFSS